MWKVHPASEKREIIQGRVNLAHGLRKIAPGTVKVANWIKKTADWTLHLAGWIKRVGQGRVKLLRGGFHLPRGRVNRAFREFRNNFSKRLPACPFFCFRGGQSPQRSG